MELTVLQGDNSEETLNNWCWKDPMSYLLRQEKFRWGNHIPTAHPAPHLNTSF